ncbi:MAG: membrane protein insertase YidC [Proteobacteria bacterium]|nr:membrane protein insertase YidC [Pseudomonadota bacterium]
MEKRMFLAVALSMLILIAWPFIFSKKKPQQVVQQEIQTTTASQTASAPDIKTNKHIKTGMNKSIAKEDVYTIENDFIKVDISSIGGKIKQATFKKYKDSQKSAIKFFSSDVEAKGALQMADLDEGPFKSLSKTGTTVSLGYKGTTINYSLSNTDPYVLKSDIKTAGSDKLKFKIIAAATKDQNQYSFSDDPQARSRTYLIYSQDKVERIPIKAKDEIKTLTFENKVNWIGISDRYFLFSVLPKNDFFTDVIADKKDEDSMYSTEFALSPKEGVYNYSIYIGPKDVSYLRKADPTLSEAIDYGWLAVISVPMLEIMKFFYKIIPNYGIAILLLTLLVRLIMYPLQHKSMKSMKKMQELQPHLKTLQEKYKNDKAKLNQEMMQFMKIHKVNPMSGCLPMLIQLPVFIALYKVLAGAVELYRSPFIFWITDLSMKDPYYIFPILMGIMMFIQQKITPNPTMDQTQAKMMLFMMPVIFTIFMLSLPSGLTLYILFSTVLGIAQQYVMNKKPASN